MVSPLSACSLSLPRFGARSFAALLAATIPVVFSGPLHAAIITADLDPTLFGNLDQDQVVLFGACACGPTAAVNSFVYLQNKFPHIYGHSLVPDVNMDGQLNQAEQAAVAIVLGGAGYMSTAINNGTFMEDFIFGKRKYLEQKVPGMTVYHAQISNIWNQVQNPPPQPSNGIPKPDFVDELTPPALRFLAEELQDGEDVEVAVAGPGSAHFLTLTGITYDDTTNRGTLRFIDPADGMFHTANLLGLNGGVIELDYQLGGNSLLLHAVSESPVPEPATWILFAIGLLGWAGYSQRQRKPARGDARVKDFASAGGGG